MELNADLAPIKPLYFEPGSKRYETGRKYSGLYGKDFYHHIAISNPMLILFRHKSLKNFNTYLLYGAL